MCQLPVRTGNRQRKLAKTITGDDLVAKKGAFTISTDKVEEVREVPFVYHPNLIAKVADIVNQHER